MKNIRINKIISSCFLIVMVLFTACKEEETANNTLRVAFEKFNDVLASEGESTTIKVVASKSASSDILVNIGVSSACGSNVGSFNYASSVDGDLTVAGGVALNTRIPAGQTEVVITVSAKDGMFPASKQSLSFDLLEVENAELNDSHLSFELLIGEGSAFLPNNYLNAFESCTNNLPTDFNQYFAEGSKTDRGFSCSIDAGVDGTGALVANAFGGNAGTVDAWLVSAKKLNFTSTSTATINMDVLSRFAGNGTLELLWSSDYCGAGSPAGATWVNLNALETQLPAKGSNTYTAVSANIAELIGESGYFAFRFSGASNDNSASYAIDNFKLGAASTGGGGGGATGTAFSTDFEGCSEDFSIPEGFIEEFLTAKTDRGWGCRGFGIDNSRAVQASAFGGAEGEDNSWLIISQAFDFSGLSTVNFQFQMYSNFTGPGQVIAQYSTDYSGSGAPDAANWTALSAINSAMPAAGSQTWTPINQDLAELGGKTVYIAFQFVGANASSSSSWAIDNLAINDAEAFSGTGGGSGGGGTGDEVTIATAKSSPGATVTITGIVTTPDYGFNNGQYFVQDATAGVNIYHAGNFGLVEAGDEVTITGQVGEFNGLIQVAPSSVTVNSSGNALPATAIITSTDLVATSPLVGSYVEISGVSLTDASQWPTEAIASGSGVNVDATVNGTSFTIRIDRGESFYEGTTAPSGTFTLKGILGRFNDTVQILPFFEGDVQ